MSTRAAKPGASGPFPGPASRVTTPGRAIAGSNAAADFYGDTRKGTNLYTDSIIALDADTGKLKWYYQEGPHDVWDFDAAYECVLFDAPVNGVPRKLLLNVNKG